jgi:hypothetical protein
VTQETLWNREQGWTADILPKVEKVGGTNRSNLDMLAWARHVTSCWEPTRQLAMSGFDGWNDRAVMASPHSEVVNFH